MIRRPVDQLRHDLRTPLIVLVGYAEMLAEDLVEDPAVPAELIERFTDVERAGRRALATLDGAAGRGDDTDATRQTTALRTAARTVLAPELDELEHRCAAVLALTRAHAAAGVLDDVEGMGRQLGVLRDLLDADDDPFDGPTDPNPASPDPVRRTDGGRVLVVDDHDGNRQLLTRQLRHLGHAVDEAADGSTALARLRSGGYDLVLLDVLMPGLGGDDVLRRLKGDPVLRDLPVIMVSALDEIHTVVRCIELGADDYLSRPFDPVLLQARVGAGLDKKRRRDAELAYLRDVEHLTAAAGAVESGETAEEVLSGVATVADRSDELGRLARVFAGMTRQVRAREAALRTEVRQLRIEIDEQRTSRQVAAITETEYFQDLQRRVDTLRLRADRSH